MLRNATLFFVGAFGYGQIELLYRGYTHWTMLVSGGVLLLVLHELNRSLPRSVPLLARCAAGAGCITGLELAMGLVCNRLLGMGIWHERITKRTALGMLLILLSVAFMNIR